MKSLHRGGIAGNIKLRGKLFKTLSCRCCDVANFKWSERVKEAIRDVRDAKSAPCKEAKRD